MVNQKKIISGFTLIELIVAIAMIGVLFAIAVPSFTRWLPASRLKSAARDVHSNLQKARVMAIKQNTPIQVRFDTSITPGFYYFDTQDDDAYTAGEYRVNLSSYGSGVDFGRGNATSNWASIAITSTIPINHVTFGTRGASNPFGTIYLENVEANICYAVTTLITGTIKIRKYNGATPFNVNNWAE